MFIMSRERALLTLAGLLWCACTATAATANDAQARYERERAACLSGASTEDQTTCLKEAAAARAAARNGKLNDDEVSPANALARCRQLPEADRGTCELRMREGSVSGSVAGGGVLRTLVQTVPAASAAGH